MAASRAHILQMPNKFIVARIIQLVVAVIILGLTIYGVIYVPFNGIILGLFTSLATLITTIYILTATYGAPSAYNYWAILSLDIFCLIFWLISMALIAVIASAYLSNDHDTYCNYYSGYCHSNLNTDLQTYGAIQAAAAGLAGLEFVLFIISTVLVSITIYRHRRAGGHCKPMAGGDAYVGSVPAGGAAYAAGPPTAEKYEMHPQDGGVPVQGAQHYVPGASPA